MWRYEGGICGNFSSTSRDRCDTSWLFKMHVAPGRCRSLEPCGIGLKLLGRTSRVRCRERGGTVEILGKRPDAQVPRDLFIFALMISAYLFLFILRGE